MQQLREKKSSGCKLMKMKIPAASCNLFLLLFLFFIFCHLDLCSSLRLIGDPSKLPHVALRTDEVECKNTVQGRYLLSDSRGYVCSIMAVNSATSCCPEVGKQYSCHGCELVSRCCDSYEYCVACCMDPAWTVVEVALKTKVAKQATARTCSSLFEFCSGRCRHNSQSVVHENAYANELHHCFSEQLNRSGESGDSAVETKLTDLTIIAARQGQSCDAACKGRRLSCAADKLSEINNCSELQSYMKCRGLCIASSGPDQPAEVVSTAPKHLLECTVVNASNGLGVTLASTVLTSQVIPAPSPTPCRLFSLRSADGLPAARKLEGRSVAPGTFTVLSCNVLADLYARSDIYSYCPPWALSWAYRRQNLLREVVGYQADILCLQEVQSDHFEEFFAPELEKHGYAAVYKKKTAEVYTGTAYTTDGCATFFRRSCFTLVKKYELEFNKAAQSLSEALMPSSSKIAALTRLLKDNVALIVVLEARETKIGGDMQGAPGQHGQLLCVANTHIHANPELKDVKLWQVHTLLKGLEKIAASADIPMLVAGDFNSIPGSAPHSLLATGRVDAAHPDLATDPLGILHPASKLCHSLPLVSACSSFGRMNGLGPTLDRQRQRMDPNSNEPLFTNCTRDFLGTLDYIFYTENTLGVESLLELLDESKLRKDTALPSPEWSSDHIALLAEFCYMPKQHQ